MIDSHCDGCRQNIVKTTQVAKCVCDPQRACAFLCSYSRLASVLDTRQLTSTHTVWSAQSLQCTALTLLGHCADNADFSAEVLAVHA